MIDKKLFLIVPVLLAIAVFFFKSKTDGHSYSGKIADIRAKKERYLKHSESSPFNQLGVQFRPIAYFPINPEYRVRATLEKIKKTQRLTLPNSDGTTAVYQKYAYAHFSLRNRKLKLLILKQIGFGDLSNIYFLGFSDETSGKESYGGGRYIDLEMGDSSHVIIDFNLAYNPYCAYTDKYVCPLPPKENILPIKISAGEKDYKH